MSNSIKSIRTYFFLLGILLIGVVSYLTFIVYNEIKSDAVYEARNIANQAFVKDRLYRIWSSRHGGTYAPVSEHAKPNPYLSHIKDRDIKLESGKVLTLINPAFMTRQVYEIAKGTEAIQTHLTSLKYLNPVNKPDKWELLALYALEDGSKEYSSVDYIKGVPYLRFMRPFYTDKGCLKCHGHQGYKVGDVRGGISVEVPLMGYFQRQTKLFYYTSGFNLLFLISGLLVLIFAYHKLKNLFATENLLRKDKETLLKELNHRVKNNLQIIYGILDLHSVTVSNPEAKDILTEIKNRIMSMSTMHNMLDFSSDVTSVNSKKYINELVDYFKNAYLGKMKQTIKVSTCIDDFELSVTQAVSCGLIINELVTNSFKHAFDDDSVSPEINISCKRIDGYVRILVKDNGKGIKDEGELDKEDSYGMLLVDSMASKIEGQISYDYSEGMKTSIVFPLTADY